ncbi:MAG: hypothetical protein PHV62_09570 [Sulfuricurvum sp.]|nr:hypothetical protein [Sulfuricurvum sp.]
MSEFTPVTKASTSIKDDLRFAASDRKLPVEQIDFDLLSYETYYKKGEDEEWHHMGGDNILTQITQEELYSSDFLLSQEYQITIRSFVPHPYLDLHFSVAMSRSKGLVTAIIDPSSIIPLKKGVKEWIKEAINKKMLRLGFMIGMADEELDVRINRLLITIQKSGSLKVPYDLIIAKFFPAIEPVDDAIILHYKKGDKNKSLIEGIEAGALILEYIFPKQGRNGRGLDGAPIIVSEPTVKYAGAIKVDDTTIRSEHDDKSTRYYAIVSGFIKREQGVFSVANELQLESVSMKKTGSIEAGIDKDIFLAVNQKIFNEDAVGMGVHIDVQKVDIDGIVGENTKIRAEELSIAAQTHRKSDIDVSEAATIQLHRGNLKAKEANIDILEGGRVEADIVHINKMLGGEVIARKVYVDVLYSHARITALESIEINSIEGEGGTLSIDPFSVGAYHEKILEAQNSIKELEVELIERSHELRDRQNVFKNKNARIKQFQKRVIDAKQGGLEPMKADVVRLKQYQKEAYELNETASKIREKEGYLEALCNKLDKLYAADLHGEVICHGSYNGLNRVVFMDPKTRQEYAVLPVGKVKRIGLELYGEKKKILQEH